MARIEQFSVHQSLFCRYRTLWSSQLGEACTHAFCFYVRIMKTSDFCQGVAANIDLYYNLWTGHSYSLTLFLTCPPPPLSVFHFLSALGQKRTTGLYGINIQWILCADVITAKIQNYWKLQHTHYYICCPKTWKWLSKTRRFDIKSLSSRKLQLCLVAMVA